MGSFIDTASAILSQSERRVEVSGQNIANITTPGYKKRVSFSTVMGAAAADGRSTVAASIGTDFSPGKLIGTNNPYDLAISGDGFFVVKTQSGLLYTRQGQFQIDTDGRLVTAQGFAVQAQGGDVILKDGVKSGPAQVSKDGTILQDGEPVAKLDIIDITDRRAAVPAQAGMFNAPDSAVRKIDNPTVRQGMLEASNVSTGDEMISIMESLRRAETGQRLVNVYDDLMGRALSIFGQA